jgi:hypothetical protein
MFSLLTYYYYFVLFFLRARILMHEKLKLKLGSQIKLKFDIKCCQTTLSAESSLVGHIEPQAQAQV